MTCSSFPEVKSLTCQEFSDSEGLRKEPNARPLNKFQERLELFFGSGVVRPSGEPGPPLRCAARKMTYGVGMSRSQLVAEHLPLLRRYARALTGSQTSGDAYVGAMLEALLQDPSLLDEKYGAKAGLFKLFTQIWNSVSLNDDSEVATLPMPPERR